MASDACGALSGASARMQLYCDGISRRVLRAFLSARGPMTVPQAAQAAGMSEESAAQAIAALAGKLLRAVEISYRSSTRSGESLFHVRLKCPFCGSPDISREEMVEHKECGYIGKLSDFRHEGAALMCPRCGMKVDEEKLRLIGTWYSCRSCGRTFPKPNTSLVGSGDGKEYGVDDLTPFKEASYALDEGVADEVREALDLLDEVEVILRAKGYSPTGPGAFKGKSGVEHSFCIVADGPDGSKALLDLLVCEQDSARILRAVTKAFDVAQDALAILLVAPGTKDPALQMMSAMAMQGLRLRIVTAPAPSGLPAALRQGL